MSTHRFKLAAAGLATAVTASVAATALAGSGASTTVSAKANTSLGETIVVDARNRTLYTLSGETRSHLKCTSATCLGAWPPVTVSSAKARLSAGSGVKGKLTVLRRSGGKFQVLLAGKPLYRFFGDRSAGQAKGDGLKSFGGTWDVIGATGAAASPAPTAATPAPTPAPPVYGY